ncbi:MAG: lipopolysaccharide biosynthesis protein [Longimicrobiales bacterium]|nr:lipopolysaccharide biosynthesis protein [Longimicrobiales bacterium]
MSDATEKERNGKTRDVRSVVIYLGQVGAANLLPLITLPVFLNLLTTDDYGYLALATAFGAVAVGLGQFGLQQGFEREFFARDTVQFQAGLLRSTLVLVSITLAAVFLLSWVFRGAVAGLFLRDSDKSGFLILVLVSQILQAQRYYLLVFFRNRGDAAAHALFSTAEAVLWAGFGLLFVAGLGMGVSGIPLGQIAGTALVMVPMIRHALRGAQSRWEGAALKDAVRVGLPLTPRVLVSVASSHLDKVLVGLIADVGGAGVYSIGQRLAYVVFSYMTALENVFVPRVLRMMFEGGDDAPERIGRYLTPFAYWSMLVAAVVTLFSYEGLLIVAPPEYLAATPIISILVVHYSLMFFSKQRQLVFAKKTHVLSMLSVVLLVLSAALNIPLVRAFGSVGAAAGTATAGAIYVWLTFRLSQKYNPISYEAGRVGIIFGGLVAVTGASLMLWWADIGLASALTIKIFLTVTFLMVGWWLRVLNRDTLHLLRSALRRVAPTTPNSSGSS